MQKHFTNTGLISRTGFMRYPAISYIENVAPETDGNAASATDDNEASATDKNAECSFRHC
jgi:hypothetical protein